MKIKTLFSALCLTASLSLQAQENNDPSGSQDWIVLFDGTNTDAWHLYNQDGAGIPELWSIQDSALVFSPGKEEGHDLVTNEVFESFVLSLDWKISEVGNSGIMWAVQEDPELSSPYLSGPEIQVLDNQRHPDGAINKGKRQSGALYDMVAPVEDMTNSPGEWNHYEITINYHINRGTVVLNGKKVTEFPLYGPEWEALVKNSKFRTWEAFGKARSGRICLQDHGDLVSYKNIKIKKLNK